MKQTGFSNNEKSNEDTFIRFLFDNSPEAMLFTTPDGTTLAANPAACRLFGRSEEEICKIGRDGLVDPDDIRLKEYYSYRTQLGAEKVELTLVRGDGSRFPAEISVRLFPFEGDQLRVLLIIRDISKQKMSDSRFRLMVNSMGETVFTVDTEMRVTGVYGRRHTGMPPEYVIGKTLREISGTDYPVHQRAVEKAFSGESGRYEWYLQDESGINWYQTTFSPLQDENGAVTGAVGIARNITELKKAQAQYQILAENTVDAIYRFNLYDEKFTYASPSVTSILGYQPEDKAYIRVPDILTPESYRKHRQSIETMLARKVDHLIDQLEVIHKDGRIIPVEVSVRPIYDSNGNPTEAIGVCRDITEWKISQQALQESEAFNASILEASPYPINVFNPDYSIRYVNPAFQELTGYSEEYLIGQKPPYPYWPDDMTQQAVDEFYVNMTRGTRDQEGRFIRKDGSEFLVLIASTPVIKDGRILYILTNWIDITEIRKAEQALRESEAFSSSLLEASPYPINVINPDFSVRYVNPALEELTGYSAEELIGTKPPYPYWEGDATVEILKNFHLAMTEGYRGRERSFIRKNGEKIWVRISNTPVKRDGRTDYILSNWVDITETRKAVLALRESEEKYRTLFDNAPIGIAVSSENERVIDVNQTLVNMHGFSSKEEFINIPMSRKYLHPEERTRWLKIIDEQGYVKGFELQLVRRDGSTFWASLDSISHYSTVAGKHYIVALQDITERKKTDEENRKMARLESVGLLAGGIAHDFNNLLMGIMGNISLAIMEVHENQEVLKILQEAEIATERASELTKQLLTFSRGGTPVVKTINIGNLIEESTSFAVRGTGNKCQCSLSDDLWVVEADESQLHQVIANLVINACEAMPTSGVINVNTGNVVIDETSSLPLSPGDYVMFTVEDSGEGIEPQYMEKLFDPYFTTKATGNGLGLATSYSIVKNHRGHITVESKPGKGTTFTVYLPAVKKSTEKVKQKKTDEIPTVIGGRILVMDDEKYLREVVGRILTRLGYTPCLTADGKEALKAYSKAMEEGRPFDAVILDLTIPGGMGGLETIQKLRELDPGVKAIVSSGFTSNTAESSYYNYGFKAIVNKPYSVSRMENVLKKLLNKKKSGARNRVTVGRQIIRWK